MQRVNAIASAGFYWLLISTALPASAQDAALEGLGLRNGSPLPALGRVVVVLVAMIALAVAAALALKRFWPAARQTNGAVKIRAQVSLGTHLKLHIVETGRTTVIVAEGRSGIAIAELAESATTQPLPPGAADAR
jgi:flagellar biogenesis protein FliO